MRHDDGLCHVPGVADSWSESAGVWTGTKDVGDENSLVKLTRTSGGEYGPPACGADDNCFGNPTTIGDCLENTAGYGCDNFGFNSQAPCLTGCPSEWGDACTCIDGGTATWTIHRLEELWYRIWEC